MLIGEKKQVKLKTKIVMRRTNIVLETFSTLLLFSADAKFSAALFISEKTANENCFCQSAMSIWVSTMLKSLKSKQSGAKFLNKTHYKN